MFFGELGDGFLETFGLELAGQMYPLNSMLRVGMKIGGSSDFTIMTADPRDVKPDDVPDIPFVMTVVGGEIVWSF